MTQDTYSTTCCGYCGHRHEKLPATVQPDGQIMVTCPIIRIPISVNGVNLNSQFVYVMVAGTGKFYKDT